MKRADGRWWSWCGWAAGGAVAFLWRRLGTGAVMLTVPVVGLRRREGACRVTGAAVLLPPALADGLDVRGRPGCGQPEVGSARPGQQPGMAANKSNRVRFSESVV